MSKAPRTSSSASCAAQGALRPIRPIGTSREDRRTDRWTHTQRPPAGHGRGGGPLVTTAANQVTKCGAETYALVDDDDGRSPPGG
eukprot:338948-Prorocentrum_minimum.AAC.1